VTTKGQRCRQTDYDFSVIVDASAQRLDRSSGLQQARSPAHVIKRGQQLRDYHAGLSATRIVQFVIDSRSLKRASQEIGMWLGKRPASLPE
jgi:hypothetical protein